jgi:hypothetical protein
MRKWDIPLLRENTNIWTGGEIRRKKGVLKNKHMSVGEAAEKLVKRGGGGGSTVAHPNTQLTEKQMRKIRPTGKHDRGKGK